MQIGILYFNLTFLVFERIFQTPKVSVKVQFVPRIFSVEVGKQGDIHVVFMGIQASSNRDGTRVALKMSNEVTRTVRIRL